MALYNVISNYSRFFQKNLAGSVSRVSPYKLIKFFLRNKLISILGHLVSDKSNVFVNYLYKYPNVDKFKNSLEQTLKSCTPVSLDQVVNHVVNGTSLPKNPLFLSFDDGHREMREIVAPILYKMGVPATFFLITNSLDNQFLIFPHRKSYVCNFLNENWSTLNEENKVKLTELVSFTGSQFSKNQLIGQISKLKLQDIRELKLFDAFADSLGISWEQVLKKYKPYLSINDCLKLQEMGFDLGSHGLDHSKFSSLLVHEREFQVEQSVNYLKKYFNIEDVSFAFPNSSLDVSEDWMKYMVNKNQFLNLFFTTDKMKRNVYPSVNRINIDKSINSKHIPLTNGFNNDICRAYYLSLLKNDL